MEEIRDQGRTLIFGTQRKLDLIPEEIFEHSSIEELGSFDIDELIPELETKMNRRSRVLSSFLSTQRGAFRAATEREAGFDTNTPEERGEAFYMGAILAYSVIDDYCIKRGFTMPTVTTTHTQSFRKTQIMTGDRDTPLAIRFTKEDLASEDPVFFSVMQDFESHYIDIDKGREFFAGAGLLRQLIMHANEIDALHEDTSHKFNRQALLIQLDKAGEYRPRVVSRLRDLGSSVIETLLLLYRKR